MDKKIRYKLYYYYWQCNDIVVGLCNKNFKLSGDMFEKHKMSKICFG